MNPEGDIALTTGSGGRTGTAGMKWRCEGIDIIGVDARRNATDAGGNRHVF